jgi:hypothetical protein
MPDKRVTFTLPDIFLPAILTFRDADFSGLEMIRQACCGIARD